MQASQVQIAPRCATKKKKKKLTISLEKKARLKPCRLQLTVPLGPTYCKSMQIMPIRRKRSAGI
jgi:hypothetical protein